MPNYSLSSFERKKLKEQENFLHDWDWDQIVKTWKSRLSDFSISFDKLFSDVRVLDAKNPVNRESKLSWWPKEESRDLHLQLQEHLDRYPGTKGPIHSYSPYHIRKGELKTLEYLWRVKDDDNGICALLIKASLFSRMNSNRGHYPRDYWPPFYCIDAISKLANEELANHFEEDFYGWHVSCTDVIPVTTNNYEYQIDSMIGMIKHLAEEHAALLLSVNPTHILFDSKTDPLIRGILNDKYKKETIRNKECKDKLERNEQEILENEILLKEKHPRLGESCNMTPKELEVLVWSKPTKLIAEEFGISDVAIGKRCKKAEIIKPPRGYWAKVKAGKIPHPNGVPTY